MPSNFRQATCTDCGKLSKIYNCSKRCIACQRKYWRKYKTEWGRTREGFSCGLRRYGLTQAQFDAFLISQSGLCAICHRAVNLVPDHDHETGKVRGLLCMRCNTGLGHFCDQPLLLEKALNYLKGKIT